jgi:hypothetical protein
MTTPSQVPSLLIAGDTWTWTRELSDYPPATWAATYYFESSAKKFSIAGVLLNASTHSFTAAAATTAGYTADRYEYRLRVVSAGIVQTIERGWVTVQDNPAAADSATDRRSLARRTLDALESALLGQATTVQLAMTVNGRSISRIPLEELLRWRDRLRAEVKGEELGDNRSKGRYIKVRLSR